MAAYRKIKINSSSLVVEEITLKFPVRPGANGDALKRAQKSRPHRRDYNLDDNLGELKQLCREEWLDVDQIWSESL